MDKNTLVGFALIGAVVIGFSIYNRPSQEEMARAKHYQDSIQAIAQKEAERLAQAATAQSQNATLHLDYLYVLWRKPRYGTANDTGK